VKEFFFTLGVVISFTLGMSICHNQEEFKQEGQHPLTGQRAPPISGGRDL